MVEFSQDSNLGLASINKSLVNFEPKRVFSWHLSIMLHLSQSDQDGLPLSSDNKLINQFEDKIDGFLKGNDPAKPNGLFLARIAWNSTVELIWRVYQPELIDSELKNILKKKKYPAPFDYQISKDEDWGHAEWHLEVASNAE